MTKNPDENQRAARFRKDAVPAKQQAQTVKPYWQSFPRMEKLLREERAPLLTQMEGTCRRLDAILKSGSPQEAARAQAAMNAYARALELYRYLATLRDNAWAASNNAASANDK